MLFLRKNKTRAFKHLKRQLQNLYPLKSTDVGCFSTENLISVVLPVYNGEKYLKESIDSVLAQTHRNFELIIVDDGSTDSSGKIADEYANTDERIKVIHQSNTKLPTALNNGFKIAKGEFYTWTSADNRMLPSCLEILSGELSKNRNIDFVYGNMRVIGENGKPLKGYGWFEFPPLSGNVILPDSSILINTVANNTIGSAFMYRNGVSKIIKDYSENLFTIEDYDYFMRINRCLTIKHTIFKRPLFEHRIHKDSLTANDENLGITKFREKLMELEELRCNIMKKPLFYYSDGDMKKLGISTIPILKRCKSGEMLKKLSSVSPARIIYLNFGNVPQTTDIPKNIPKYLITQDPIEGIFSYDEQIFFNRTLSDYSNNQTLLKDKSSLFSFLFYRGNEDIMHLFEKDFFKL